jgi:hypothetical protein
MPRLGDTRLVNPSLESVKKQSSPVAKASDRNTQLLIDKDHEPAAFFFGLGASL